MPAGLPLKSPVRQIVASHCNVGWDIRVFVGRSLFQRYQTTDQICDELKLRNIELSPSEVEYLGRKFILYLALAHRQAAPSIERAIQRSGGYILHLDATHEKDAPALMTGMDGLRNIVLANVKIPSGHADHIVPFLEQLQKDYGTPIACVHDMGTCICKAVIRVSLNPLTILNGAPDFLMICWRKCVLPNLPVARA
jgi:hypothetical protein